MVNCHIAHIHTMNKSSGGLPALGIFVPERSMSGYVFQSWCGRLSLPRVSAEQGMGPTERGADPREARVWGVC